MENSLIVFHLFHNLHLTTKTVAERSEGSAAAFEILDLSLLPSSGQSAQNVLDYLRDDWRTASRGVTVFAMKQYSGVDRFLFLLAGIFCLWSAIRGLSTGEIGLQFATFKRSNSELLFWFGIGMNILIGLMCLTGFIFGMDLWK
jgi:hypothetical protein